LHRRKEIFQQRVDLSRIPVEHADPMDLLEAIGEPLRALDVAQP
jgi:hypothetical protein